MKIKRSLTTYEEGFGFRLEDETCRTVEIRVVPCDHDETPDDEFAYQIIVMGFAPSMAAPVQDQIESWQARPWLARSNPFQALATALKIAQDLIAILQSQDSPSDEEKDGIF
jgi:hypothetical protein